MKSAQTSNAATPKKRRAPVSSPRTSRLDRARLVLLYALIPSLFLSFYPVIKLGSSDSTNFELSLPLIILALYSLLSIPALCRRFPRHAYPLLFPVFALLSVFWSENPIRTVLTSGILFCLCISVLTIPKLISNNDIKEKIIKLFFSASVVVCVFCWLQCILDLVGVDRCHSLLCEGCVYQSFGFPHPNGFAVEPQFMGNLLLAPAVLSLFLLCRKRTLKRAALAFFIILTLFITFSRGAIYALLIATFIIVVYEVVQSVRNRGQKPAFRLHLSSVFTTISVILVSLLCSLSAQGVMAAVSPTSDTFKTGVAKAISQLSLGRIELFPEARTAIVQDSLENAEIVTDTVITEETFSGSSVNSDFEGYVAESTNQRLKLNNYALDLWNDDLGTILFGVGLGSAGPRLFEKFPDLGHSKEIVQNEYASILLETGLVGSLLAAVMAAGFLVFLFYLSSKTKNPRSASAYQIYLLSLIVAYAVTLFFFSGLPNALHIYLMPVILAALADPE